MGYGTSPKIVLIVAPLTPTNRHLILLEILAYSQFTQPPCYVGVDTALLDWEVQNEARIRYPCRNRRAPCSG